MVYVFALIAGALILAWGVNTVIKLQETAAMTEWAKFATKTESTVQQYLNFDEGSSTAIKVSMPAKLKHLCFYDSTHDTRCTLDGKDCDVEKLDPKFARMIELTNPKYNMYFLPTDAFGNKMRPKEIENMKIDTEVGNPICFTNTVRNEFILTSMGTYVSVS